MTLTKQTLKKARTAEAYLQELADELRPQDEFRAGLLAAIADRGPGRVKHG